MVKLVIFDFDGVIITGSNEGYFRCYHKTLETVGVSLDPSEERKRILQIWGKGYKYQLQLLLKEHPEILPKAVKIYEKYYWSPLFSINIKLIKGAKGVLTRLSKLYTLVIGAGMRRKRLEILTKQFKLEKYFKIIISNSDIENPDNKKPSPYMLNMIVDRYRVHKNEAIYVTDAKSDVEMALKAGITPVIVLTGHLSKDEAKKLKIKYIIPDIAHLPKLLASI
ncbi:MAG: HAD family hydrolase [Candidatus Levybacteria bacterium]|nr:HAD family hydrolase [Candidatus Levybacteria bacterium]